MIEPPPTKKPSSAWIFCPVCICQSHRLCFRTFFLPPSQHVPVGCLLRNILLRRTSRSFHKMVAERNQGEKRGLVWGTSLAIQWLRLFFHRNRCGFDPWLTEWHGQKAKIKKDDGRFPQPSGNWFRILDTYPSLKQFPHNARPCVETSTCVQTFQIKHY